MQIIHHRINSLCSLEKIPYDHGIEVDVRYHENNLILKHDPFNHHINSDTKLIDLLKVYKCSGPIILNLKTEGIENECINLMTKYNIKNWFFLDMTIPFLVRYADKAHKKKIQSFSPANLAVRFSDMESIENALSFKDKVKWIWIDYFSEFPLNKKIFSLIKKANFKICLVSPELQEDSIFTIEEISKICSELKIDAICTKKPDLWIC